MKNIQSVLYDQFFFIIKCITTTKLGVICKPENMTGKTKEKKKELKISKAIAAKITTTNMIVVN